MPKILFLCTGNSARSQMAEGLMKSLGTGQWEVKSAGILPSFVHPIAIQVMKEVGIDISHQASKSVERFSNEVFDYTITLCDYAATLCPAFPGQGKRLHWPFEDPASAIGTNEQRLAVFRKIRDQIKRKIVEFLKLEGA
jgi:arsenate reductase